MLTFSGSDRSFSLSWDTVITSVHYLAPEERARPSLMAGPIEFVIPGRWKNIHAGLCSHPESLEEIPPTDSEMLDVSWSLIRVTSQVRHGHYVSGTWRYLERIAAQG